MALLGSMILSGGRRGYIFFIQHQILAIIPITMFCVCVLFVFYHTKMLLRAISRALSEFISIYLHSTSSFLWRSIAHTF